MATQTQFPRKLTPKPVPAMVAEAQRRERREEANPEMIVQIVGYGLVWIGLLVFAVVAVAMASGRLVF